MASIDETIIVNKGLPKTWKCPHCGKTQRFGIYAESILFEHFKYLEQCENCGYVHYWELQLTEDFKKQIVAEAISIAESYGLKKEDIW